MLQHDDSGVSRGGRVLGGGAGFALLVACFVGCGAEGPSGTLVQDGRVYDRLELPEPDEDASAPVQVVTPVLSPADLETVSLRAWPRERLASELRPVLLLEDGAYVARDPNWGAADAVLADDGKEGVVDLLAKVETGAVGTIQAPMIFGNDDRDVVENTNTHPFRAIVKLRLYTGSTSRGHCTGAYIGPRTVITSAHCLYLEGGVTINRIIFERGRNGDTVLQTADCRRDDELAFNNYLATLPAGYVPNRPPDLDYAVIRTDPCHTSPAYFGGFAYNPSANTYKTFGYPAQCPGEDDDRKHMCGMAGAAEPIDWKLESQVIDGEPGQSGSPWWRMYDHDRPAGVFKGYTEYWDFFRCGFDACRRNYARKIDVAYRDLIFNASPDM